MELMGMRPPQLKADTILYRCAYLIQAPKDQLFDL